MFRGVESRPVETQSRVNESGNNLKPDQAPKKGGPAPVSDSVDFGQRAKLNKNFIRALELPPLAASHNDRTAQLETLAKAAQLFDRPNLKGLKGEELRSLQTNLQALQDAVATHENSAEHKANQSWRDSWSPLSNLIGYLAGWNGQATRVENLAKSIRELSGRVQKNISDEKGNLEATGTHRQKMRDAIKGGQNVAELLAQAGKGQVAALTQEDTQALYDHAVASLNPLAMNALQERGASAARASVAGIFNHAVNSNAMTDNTLGVLKSLLASGNTPKASDVERNAQAIINGDSPQMREQLAALHALGLPLDVKLKSALDAARLGDAVRNAMQTGNVRGLHGLISGDFRSVVNTAHRNNTALDVALSAYRASKGKDKKAFDVARLLLDQGAQAKSQTAPENWHASSYTMNLTRAMDTANTEELNRLLSQGIQSGRFDSELQSPDDNFAPQIGNSLRAHLFNHAFTSNNVAALNTLVERNISIPEEERDAATTMSGMLTRSGLSDDAMPRLKWLLEHDRSANLKTEKPISDIIANARENADLGALRNLSQLKSAGLTLSQANEEAFNAALAELTGSPRAQMKEKADGLGNSIGALRQQSQSAVPDNEQVFKRDHLETHQRTLLEAQRQLGALAQPIADGKQQIASHEMGDFLGDVSNVLDGHETERSKLHAQVGEQLKAIAQQIEARDAEVQEANDHFGDLADTLDQQVSALGDQAKGVKSDPQKRFESGHLEQRRDQLSALLEQVKGHKGNIESARGEVDDDEASDFLDDARTRLGTSESGRADMERSIGALLADANNQIAARDQEVSNARGQVENSSRDLGTRLASMRDQIAAAAPDPKKFYTGTHLEEQQTRLQKLISDLGGLQGHIAGEKSKFEQLPMKDMLSAQGVDPRYDAHEASRQELLRAAQQQLDALPAQIEARNKIKSQVAEARQATQALASRTRALTEQAGSLDLDEVALANDADARRDATAQLTQHRQNTRSLGNDVTQAESAFKKLNVPQEALEQLDATKMFSSLADSLRSTNQNLDAKEATVANARQRLLSKLGTDWEESYRNLVTNRLAMINDAVQNKMNPESGEAAPFTAGEVYTLRSALLSDINQRLSNWRNSFDAWQEANNDVSGDALSAMMQSKGMPTADDAGAQVKRLLQILQSDKNPEDAAKALNALIKPGT